MSIQKAIHFYFKQNEKEQVVAGNNMDMQFRCDPWDKHDY